MNIWINYLPNGPLWKAPNLLGKLHWVGTCYGPPPRPWPHGMSRNCLPDLWSFLGDGPETGLKMFPPGMLSKQGTPAAQMTHFQFHFCQINLFLTYRKGLNTGLTPGQMPLASKQPGIDPQSQCHWPGRKQPTPNGICTFTIVPELMRI